MNSFTRTMLSLKHKEPDRVPLFLLFTYYGARELGINIKDYLSKAENIVEGQKRLLAKFEHDCLYPFTHAALEASVFGQEIEFYDDGPPNAGEPILKSRDDIFKMEIPDPVKHDGCREALKAVVALAKEYKNKVPILSSVIGPFSLPIMLLGLKGWIEIFVAEDKEAIDAMVAKTSAFCVRWTNLIFDSGADAVGFFEPFGSATMVTPKEFEKYILDVDKNVISQFKGPAIFCGAGGRIEPIFDKLIGSGVAGCLLSVDDDLENIKNKYGANMVIAGNLNNIAMVGWDYDTAKSQAAKCIEKAKKGSGYILADQHGEISWEVKEEALRGIADAVKEFGTYR